MTGTTTSSSSTPKDTIGGRIGGVIFGLLFLGFGVVFTGLMVREVWRGSESRAWPRVPCTILASRVNVTDNDDHPYLPLVRYRYAVDGAEHTGEQVRLGAKPLAFDDYRDAQLVVDRFPAGSAATAFVDPRDPARAALEHGSMTFLYFLPLPLLFVLIGGGVVWVSVRPRTRAVSDGAAIATPAISDQSRLGRRGILAFFTLFLLVGLGTAVPLLILPAVRLWQARNWPTVACTIVRSSVHTNRSSDGDTYRPDVLYRYTFDGREHQSSRFDLSPKVSTGNYSANQAVVKQYRRGGKAVCYVDPSDPTLAVLDRAPTWRLMIAIVPIAFMLIGGGGLWFAMRRPSLRFGGGSDQMLIYPRNKTSGAGGSSAGAAASGPIVLSARQSPMTKFIVILLIALFWNGIVSVFVVNVFSDWHRGRGDMCGTAFMIPFVLIGLALIVGVGYTFLGMFNPRPVVTVMRGPLRIGSMADLRWGFTGRYDRISRLKIKLQAREEATYRRGTDTVTDKRVFHQVDVIDTSRGTDIASGGATLAIPPETMHSLSGRNNRIVWELSVHGEIAGWPDVKEDFLLDVLPLEVAR